MNETDGPNRAEIRRTPSTPTELASIQHSDEARLIHGLDLSTKARALYLYGDELRLSIHELIHLSFAHLRRAEYDLEVLIKEEQASSSGHHPNLDHLYHWCVASGGLTSIRLTLQAMLETAGDAGLWKTCPPWGQRPQKPSGADNSFLEQRLLDLTQLRQKGLLTQAEFAFLRAEALGLPRGENADFCSDCG